MLSSFFKFSILTIFLIPICSQNTFALYPTDKIEVVLEEAETYLGVRWKMGGTTRRTIDCSALVQNSFKKAGFNIPRTSRSQHGWDRGINLKKTDTYQPGDLLFFSSGGHYVGHVGIVSEVLGDQIRFIHASSNNKKVAFDILEDYADIFVGGKRLFEKIPNGRDILADPKKESGKDSSNKEGKAKELAFEWVPPFPNSDQFLSTKVESDKEKISEEEIDLSFNFKKEKPTPRSSQKRLKVKDIEDLNPCEIRILKNTIFARHGYEFYKNEAMREHFESLAWYQRIENKSRNEFFVRSKFSVIDKANVAFLKQYEGPCNTKKEESRLEKSLNKIKNFKLKNIIARKN
jgi:hypothetical protein